MFAFWVILIFNLIFCFFNIWNVLIILLSCSAQLLFKYIWTYGNFKIVICLEWSENNSPKKINKQKINIWDKKKRILFFEFTILCAFDIGIRIVLKKKRGVLKQPELITRLTTKLKESQTVLPGWRDLEYANCPHPSLGEL